MDMTFLLFSWQSKVSIFSSRHHEVQWSEEMKRRVVRMSGNRPFLLVYDFVHFVHFRYSFYFWSSCSVHVVLQFLCCERRGSLYRSSGITFTMNSLVYFLLLCMWFLTSFLSQTKPVLNSNDFRPRMPLTIIFFCNNRDTFTSNSLDCSQRDFKFCKLDLEWTLRRSFHDIQIPRQVIWSTDQWDYSGIRELCSLKRPSKCPDHSTDSLHWISKSSICSEWSRLVDWISYSWLQNSRSESRLTSNWCDCEGYWCHYSLGWMEGQLLV